ncbi:MAG: O-acetyl-ADP-ribose deacetylase [Rhodothermales bacterium]
MRPSPADRIELIQADITTLEVDAIVNAANAALAGGGGVDGAIHRAAGPKLLEACLQLRGCPTGQAKITPGFDLPADYVIHAVGPVWHSGDRGEDDLLASCYRTSLQLAVEHGCTTVAFPAISCGVYRFPVDRAAGIAVRTVAGFLRSDEQIEAVYLVSFGKDVRQAHERAYADVLD